MKKNTLITIFILFANLAMSQCDNYSNLLTAGLNKTVFFDANNGFVFGQGTLIKTNDGGANWSFVEVPFRRFDTETLKYCDKLDSNSAIIVGQDGTMLKTVDKGQTWTAMSLMINGQENINCVDFINSNIGYATAYTSSPQQSYFMKTTNGGLTWSQITTSFGSNINFYDIINIRFLTETTGFAWSGYYLFKTINGGVTWTQIANPSGTTNTNRISMLKVSENNKIVISLKDTVSKFYVSSDSGNSWTLVSSLSPTNNTYVTSPVFEIKNNKVFVVADVGTTTLIKSFVSYDLTNNGYVSNPINLELGTVQSDIYFLDINIGYIIDRGNIFWADAPGRKIFKTTNGGLNWNEIDSFSLINPGTQNNIKVLLNSADTLTLTKQDVYNGWNYDFFLYTSTHDGTTWQQKLRLPAMTVILLRASGNYISYIRLLNPVNGAEGFSLYESNDLGNTWEHSNFMGPINTSLNGFVQLDLNTLRCGYNSEINLSLDKGQSWTTVPMPSIPNVNFYDSKIKSVNEIYAWGKYDNWPSNYDYYLYKTIDMGQTWQQVVTIPDNNGVDLGATASTTIFGSNYAFVSTGGNTYYRVNLNTNTYTQIPFTNPNSNQVYVDSNLKFLNDTKWLINTSSGYKISTNQGQTWSPKKCLICSNNIIYDDVTNDFISYDNDHGVERTKGIYLPETPIIYGNATVLINHLGNYFIPYNSMITPTWDTIPGGTSTFINSNYLQVNWTQLGTHTIRAKYINDCGESAYYEFIVNVVSVLSTNDNQLENKISVFPNPFKNELRIENLESSQSEIKIYNITGQMVFSNTFYNNQVISINNLENLQSGTYFLVIENNSKTYTHKLIKL